MELLTSDLRESPGLIQGHKQSEFRKFLGAWLLSILGTQIIAGAIFWNDFYPVTPPTFRLVVFVSYSILWLPISYFLLDRIFAFTKRYSFSAWFALFALPVVLIIAFLLSVTGMGISDFFGSSIVKALMGTSWGLAGTSTLLTIPIWVAGCIWLFIRLKRIQQIGATIKPNAQ